MLSHCRHGDNSCVQVRFCAKLCARSLPACGQSMLARGEGVLVHGWCELATLLVSVLEASATIRANVVWQVCTKAKQKAGHAGHDMGRWLIHIQFLKITKTAKVVVLVAPLLLLAQTKKLNSRQRQKRRRSSSWSQWRTSNSQNDIPH